MSTDLPVLTAADFASDQDVRWCPGCGDYSILAQMKKVMPTLGIPQEKTGLCLRHWLLKPVSVLHEYLWHAQYSWSGAGHRHGTESRLDQI